MVQLALLCFAALMGVVIANTELKLWTAAAEGDMTHVDEYLTKGTSPLWQNPDHWAQDSALHIASRNNHTEVVKRLLDAGVDVNLTNGVNQTAMIIASRKGYTAVATLVIDHKADVSLADRWGWTPLHGASANGNIETAALLISKGANVNLGDKDGQTPLHEATRAYREHTALVTLLISNGGEVNHVDDWGQTPLHVASARGYTDTAKILMANGADPGITDKGGNTAGDIARRRGHIELVNILDSSTSTTVSLATSPAATPAPNGATKHEAAAPRPIPLLPLMQLLPHPTGQLHH